MEERTTETVREQRTYEIGGVRYRIAPASYRQHRWLAEGPLKGVDFMRGGSQAELQTIIHEYGALILGIVLLEDGQTIEQKAKAGLEAARALAEQVQDALTPQEVREAAEHFFVIDGYANLMFFVDVRKAADSMPVETTVNGSTPPSVSSPAATSPSAPPWNAERVLATASPISGDSSSGSLPT